MAQKAKFDPRYHLLDQNLFPNSASGNSRSSSRSRGRTRPKEPSINSCTGHDNGHERRRPLDQPMYTFPKGRDRRSSSNRRRYDIPPEYYKNNKITEWEDQNRAFLGNSNAYTSTSKKKATIAEKDREIARQLQRQLNEEDKQAEYQSIALAKRLTLEEEQRNNTNNAHRDNEDRKMAERMQQIENERRGNHSYGAPPRDETKESYFRQVENQEDDDDEYISKVLKLFQEQEDEELARVLEREQSLSMSNSRRGRRLNDEGLDGIDTSEKPNTTVSSSSRKPSNAKDIDNDAVEDDVDDDATGDGDLATPSPRFITAGPIDSPAVPSFYDVNIENDIDKNNELEGERNRPTELPPTPLCPIADNKKKKRNILSRFLPQKQNEKPSSSGLKNNGINQPHPPNNNGPQFPPPSNKMKPNQNNGSQNSSNCSVCGLKATNYLLALGKKYHLHCFTCMGCCELIDPSESFAYTTTETGEKMPLHRNCHAELFGMKCAVCKETIPYGEDGTITYVKHPFFSNEQMCPSHASDVRGRRCTGCHRFEPIGSGGFAELYDAGRCACFSCCRTVIVDSEDAKPLWNKVTNFFENHLGLPIWDGLRDIPVLIVGFETLNESSRQQAAHSGTAQIMTRGLCLSEHQPGKKIELAKMRFDKHKKNFENVESRGFTYFQVPETSDSNPNSKVTAILCLSGLPSDLTASVLAHEATHAWFKLHPDFDILRPIPLMVEEGCCQLMALLFLTDGLGPANEQTYDDGGPSDASLRQYFKFSIETDESEIYGTGFRLAAKAYAKIGIEALLSHVVRYREFPDI
eukprot:CAMPEP_0178971144 /NCGR_PEP_ID=MMETSP0789-20121207/20073_1 /TAXON_ID=3005 /ORGANISM="Rhizosolenia setigera, Strain CCMP 1694" /LENGTH=804 /DNA_ID=CAMNT_0020658005 /DNA_START=49 /DNA_END=2463 /DNA_ORIENTATION=+